MPDVHDFVPIDGNFEDAGSVLVSRSSPWLTEAAAAAFDGSEPVAIEFGDARMIARSVVVPVHWVAGKGPFTTLEAHLRLEPMPARHSHLSFAGTYEVSLNGHDVLTEQHLTESCVRRFLVGVAAALEQGRSDQT